MYGMFSSGRSFGIFDSGSPMDSTGLLKSDLPAFLNLRFAAVRAFLFEANRKTKEPAGKPFAAQAKSALRKNDGRRV
jgi:hypothetical protein